VREAFHDAFKIVLIWTTGTGITLFLLAGFVAHLFSKDPAVITVTRTYLMMVPLTAAGYGFVIATAAGFNALGRPLPGLALSFGRSIVLSAGGAWLGGHYFGLKGAIAAFVVSNIISGLTAWWYVRHAPMQARQRKGRDTVPSEVVVE